MFLVTQRVVVALVGLLAAGGVGAGARRDLRQFCNDLKTKMAPNHAVFSDAEVALKEAQKHLHSVLNIGIKSRFKLAKAWELVVREEPCDEQSGEHVAIIAECKPERQSELATLYHAVRAYSNRCLTPDFWDKQLRRTLKPDSKQLKWESVNLYDKTNLKSFLNHQFIQRYRRDNPDEPKPRLYPVAGRTCCEPARSTGAMIERVAPFFGVRPDQNALEVLKREPILLVGTLQKFLFTPCKIYLKTLDTLMEQASGAAQYHFGLSQAFFDSLSSEFSDAIFRYKYCQSFRHLLVAEDKVDLIGILQ